jgi:hypothetical protein
MLPGGVEILEKLEPFPTISRVGVRWDTRDWTLSLLGVECSPVRAEEEGVDGKNVPMNDNTERAASLHEKKKNLG